MRTVMPVGGCRCLVRLQLVWQHPLSFLFNTISSVQSTVVQFFVPFLRDQVCATLKMRSINWIFWRRVYCSLLQHKSCTACYSLHSPLCVQNRCSVVAEQIRRMLDDTLAVSFSHFLLNHGESALKHNISYCLYPSGTAGGVYQGAWNTNIFRDFHAVEDPVYFGLE